MTNYIDGQDPPVKTLTDKKKTKARTKRIADGFERYFKLKADGWAELFAEAHSWLERDYGFARCKQTAIDAYSDFAPSEPEDGHEGWVSAPRRLRKAAGEIMEYMGGQASIPSIDALRVIYIYWLITHVDTSEYEFGAEQDWGVEGANDEQVGDKLDLATMSMTHRRIFNLYSESIICEHDIELWESLCEKALKVVMPKSKTREYNNTGRKNLRESQIMLVVQYAKSLNLKSINDEIKAIKKEYPGIRMCRKTYVGWRERYDDKLTSYHSSQVK